MSAKNICSAFKILKGGTAGNLPSLQSQSAKSFSFPTSKLKKILVKHSIAVLYEFTKR